MWFSRKVEPDFTAQVGSSIRDLQARAREAEMGPAQREALARDPQSTGRTSRRRGKWLGRNSPSPGIRVRLVSLALWQAMQDGASRVWCGMRDEQPVMGYTVAGKDRDLIPPPPYVAEEIAEHLIAAARLGATGSKGAWLVEFDDGPRTFTLEREGESCVIIHMPTT